MPVVEDPLCANPGKKLPASNPVKIPVFGGAYAFIAEAVEIGPYNKIIVGIQQHVPFSDSCRNNTGVNEAGGFLAQGIPRFQNMLSSKRTFSPSCFLIGIS